MVLETTNVHICVHFITEIARVLRFAPVAVSHNLAKEQTFED